MKIAIAINLKKSKSVEALNKVIQICKKIGIEYCFIEKYQGIDITDNCNCKDAATLLTIGGDGTILYAVKKVQNMQVLGIHTGKLGLLTEVQIDSIEQALISLNEGKYTLDKRTMLSLSDGNKFYNALNDVVVNRAGRKLIEFSVSVGNCNVGAICADGLIICTPTGSTAYSLVCGGSVMASNTSVIGVTPLNAQNLNVRPLVVSDKDSIVIKLLSERAAISIDGSNEFELETGNTITVLKSNMSIPFVRIKNDNYYDRLSAKLNIWGSV